MPAHLIAEEGPLQGMVLNLEEDETWIIGRDPDQADFVLDDAAVSRKHVKLENTPDGLVVKNLSRVGKTLVNEQEISEPTLLKQGDTIRIGGTLFRYVQDQPSAVRPKTPNKPAKGGYDDIFGDLEEPELPPEPEPIEETAAEETAVTLDTEADETHEDASEEEPAKSAYDTIFEDIGQESEMPMHLMPETPLILKVIGGPNAGAEIGLEKGRSYTLGKDPNACDIAFQDLSVSRQHAKLTVSPDGIIDIEDLGSKNGTVVNGALLTEKKTLTLQDLIAMGTTIFLIIDREAVQETIYSPLSSVYESQKPEEKIEVEPEELPPEEEKLPEWKEEKIPTKYLVLAGSLAAIFLIVFLSFFSLFKSERIELTQKMPHEDVDDALKPFSGVHYTFNTASGKLFLAGHVLTAVDYQEMRYNLSLVPQLTSIENNVVIDETVCKSMNDVLGQNPQWRGISIASKEPGKFVIHGYVQTLQEASTLGEYVTTNFPYLDKLQSDVVVEETLNLQILGLLQSHGFAAVTFQLANGELFLAGRYPEQHADDFKKTLDAINKLQGVQTVKNYAVATTASTSRIDVTQQYTVTGSALFDHTGYSAIINGKIYMIGNTIDGMKITGIESNEIFLEKDGMKYKIDYIH